MLSGVAAPKETRLAVTLADVVEREMADATTTKDALQLTLSRLGVGTITTDAAGMVESMSPFAQRLTGWTGPEAVGQPADKVFHLVRDHVALPGEACGVTDLAAPVEKAGVEEAILVSRTGERCAIEHALAPVRDAQGRITGITIIFHDVSQQNLAALQLARSASHDPLTALLNRHAFTVRADALLRELPTRGRLLGICHLDLDQFNLVNNSCGHMAGDDLLLWVAAILREETQETDVLARLGGDVFALLLQRDTVDEIRGVAEAVLARLHSFVFSWEDKTFPVGACIGVVPVTHGGNTIAEVMAAAEHACVRAKQMGRNQLRLCHLEDEELKQRRQEMEWVARIKEHLQHGGVCLYAQPIRPLAAKHTQGLGMEILLRMRQQGGDPTSAGMMIRAAERYGLMGAIDRWVIRSTLQELQAQPREVVDRLHLCCINISSGSLHDRTILEFIHQQLADARIAPGKICFELTETAAVENLPQARWLIGELQGVGCRFALDDFGSGLPSFAHLRELPVSFIKIAGEFVETIAADPLSRAMVESINQIGRVLGIATIAEAVSTEAALGVVREIGIDYAQGNWIGVPRPLADICRVA
jgi:diguanylate cyclase (GGDEF)-like protein/PAS domain S-box-containing protein